MVMFPFFFFSFLVSGDGVCTKNDTKRSARSKIVKTPTSFPEFFLLPGNEVLKTLAFSSTLRLGSKAFTGKNNLSVIFLKA